jgi:hypothetical protein
VVDPLAARVTNRLLLSFRRFDAPDSELDIANSVPVCLSARRPHRARLAPVAVVLAAAASSLFLFMHAPSVRAQCGGASESPCPTPIPVNAFISLDVTAGDPTTVINVTGGQFLPNEQMSLYWDTTNHVAGSATADSNGNFNVRIKPFAGDSPGVHKLCASVPPNPCANFTLNAAATSPSPSPTPTESPSASPTAVATVNDTPTSTPAAATLNGFDVISRPPFVFLPIAGAVAIGLAFGFWLFSVVRRRPQMAIPAAAVVHRATRPDYTSSFGTAPPTTPPAPEQSGWPEVPQSESPPAAPPDSTISNTEWGPPVEWGTGSSDWGFPEPPPDDSPETPEPGD